MLMIRSRLCRALLALAILAAGHTALPADEVPLRVMTFNARYAGTFDGLVGPNGWYGSPDPASARKFKVQRVIADNAPDIVGTQELLDFQLHDLTNPASDSSLSGYDHYGVARDDGVSAGEYSAILYRSDRFTRLDAGSFWLSLTPEVPSIYPGAGTNRIASWVMLLDQQSQQRLFVLDSHFDNVSGAARQYGADLIRSRLDDLSDGAATLIMGDFNTTQSSNVVRTLLGQNDPGGLQLADSYRAVHPVTQSNEQTYHDFGGGTIGSRIDFILNSAELSPYAAQIIRTSYGGKYPSDHYPVVVDFNVQVVPEPGSIALFAIGTIVLVGARRFRRR